MGCPGCETLPRVEDGAGRLYLAPALGHSLTRLRRQLAGSERWHGEVAADGVISIAVDAGERSALLAELGAILSPPECETCRSVFIREEETFDIAALARMQPLAVPLARARSAWLMEMIRGNCLTAHFQPIVHAAEPTRAFAHEALLRGENGTGDLIPPDRLFAAARASDLLFHLDRVARITAIREAARHELQGSVFINFNPSTIYDPEFCLRTTLEAARETGSDPGRFVFEVVESDRVEDADHLSRILGWYRNHGFRVALDDLGAGYNSLNSLTSLRPDFVKVDRELVRGVEADPARQSILGHLIGMAGDLGIGLIAEGVETAGEYRWLSDAGVDYLQGFYFARPAAPPLAPSPGVER